MRPPDPRALARLEAFLASPARPAGTLTLGELYGFLFAVTSAPERVRLSEVLRFVFGDGPAGCATLDQANEVLAWIGGLYDQIVRDAQSGHPHLPPSVVFRPDPMENFAPDCSVSRWARGFSAGHDWLAGSMEVDLPDHADEEFAAAWFVLAFFASRKRADEYEVLHGLEEPPLEEAARRCVEIFQDAMESYATIGRKLYRSHVGVLSAGPTRRRLVPRGTDPCPCGSGRKFQRCCGAFVH